MLMVILVEMMIITMMTLMTKMVEAGVANEDGDVSDLSKC